MAKKKKKKVARPAPSETGPAISSFEDDLHELEKIVSELEAGNLTLADSLEKYEKGIRNLKSCHQILEHAENRIRILTGIDPDGTTETADFDSRKTEIHQRSEKRNADADFAGVADESRRDADSEDVIEEDESDKDDEDGGDIVDDSRTLF